MFRDRLGPLLRRAPWVAALTLPWLALSWGGTAANWDPVRDPAELPLRFGQALVEAGVAIPWLGWAVLLPIAWPRATPDERRWLVLGGGVVAASLILAPLALSQGRLVTLGIRYLAGLLPIAAGITAVLVWRASGGRPLRMAALLAVFGASHLAGGALPALAIGESGRLAGGLVVSVPRTLPAKLFNVTWWDLVRSRGRGEPGTASLLIDHLERRAGPDDVIVTNYSWENLYFYGGRPQGLRLPLAGAVRTAALEAGLPGYVFGVDGADWVVWRPAAEPIPGWDLARITGELAEQGATLERVATFRETLTENRPELHYHRFPGLGMVYAPTRMGAAGPRLADAEVHRVVR
jgi:hypothetical protein